MKLLKGQQLYISKHMHNQLLHEDIADPPPAPPITRLAPCITKSSLGGVLLTDTYMHIRERTGPMRQFEGQSIGPGNWLFQDIPDKLRDAYVAVGNTYHHPWTGQHLNSFLAAATLHWLKVARTFNVTLKGYGFYGEYVKYNVGQYTSYSSIHADEYSAAAYLPIGGPWSITILWLPNEDGHEELRVPGYSFPSGYTMRVFWPPGYTSAVWTCFRNLDGTYDAPYGIYA